MISATIVGGFLGAGKTTWLRCSLAELADSADPASITVIVNDFADQGVDDGLIAAAVPDGMKVQAINSGCVCCDKLDELVRLLLSVVEDSHRRHVPSQQKLFIETSGLANPQPILAAIESHPVLKQNIRVENLVVIADGQNALAQLRHHPLARTQLLCADQVVISKADIADTAHVATLCRLVAQLNPAAAVSGSSMGKSCTLPQSAGDIATPDLGSWAHGDVEPTATVLAVSSSVCWEQFALWFDALIHTNPDQVLRSKGTIMTPAGPIVLQSVGPTIPLPTTVPAMNQPHAASTSMVFITAGIDPEVIDRSFRTYVPSGSVN